jgi:hypothetical protein
MNSPYRRFYLQHRDGIERPSAWRGRRYWVVARSLCAFRVFRLPEAERSNLKDFAALKVREWAPYEEVGFHLHLTQDTARIWAWDAARVRDGMLAMGITPGRLTVIPETAVHERAGDGVHLLACLDGFEGQVWSQGELKAGRWWAERPNPEQWLEFQRAAGLVTPSLDNALNAVQPLWRARAWTNSGSSWGFGIERRGREVAIAVAGLLLTGYCYLGGSLARDAWLLSQVEDRVQSAEQRSAPAAADRERALANLKFLNDFAKLSAYPSQLELLARVAEKLPANGARIIAWSYQNGDLQFTVFSPASSIDVLFYVKTYSTVERFTDVTADRAEGNRSIRVKARVVKS